MAGEALCQPPRQREPMPQVIIEQPGVPPMTVPLDKDEVSFGRSEECDVVLIADEVSRHHARICRRGDMVVLFDNKSLNGTYVNRQRIVERVLTHMDELWFGSKCRLIYRDDTKLGRKEQPENAVPNSGMIRNMDKIRAEMERVGNSMTMIGQTANTGGNTQTVAPPATGDDMVKMGQAYRRLNALWRASNIMASNFDLRQRLVDVLDLVIELLGADRGFVMLREPGTHNLNVKVAREMGRELEASSPSMGIAGRAAIDGEPVLMNDRSSGDHEFAGRHSIIQSAILSAMCVPLRVQEKLIGSIYVDTRKAITFTDEDLELFNAVAAQAAVAIDHLDQHNRLMEAARKQQDFSRFLSPDVVEKIMQDETSLELGGQKTTATTMFCDIRGFTNISERLTPQEIVAMLNEHFTAVTEIIFELKGTINKFIGDEIMCVFGAPFTREDDALNAVKAGLWIQQKVAELNEVRARENRPVFLVGVGIETGEVSAGYIGSPMRMEYTVIGDRVNVASRLCSKAQPGQVVVGPNTWEAVKDQVVGAPIGEVALKGKALPLLLHEVTAIR